MQYFPFAAEQPGIVEYTQAGPISGVLLDGTGSTTVPFVTPFNQYVLSVVAQYTPPTPGLYQIVVEVLPMPPATSLATSLNGFVLMVYGGTMGVRGNFTYIAQGL
jgi:hypothetical protein